MTNETLNRFKAKVFVSGLWLINGNHKNSDAHYLDKLDSTLSRLHGCKLVFYCAQESVIAALVAASRKYHIDLDMRIFDIHESYYSEEIDRFVNKLKESSIILGDHKLPIKIRVNRGIIINLLRSI